MSPRMKRPASAPLLKPLLLLCNDDGFFRREIRILQRRLGSLGRAVIVAPDRERSASSLAVTLRQPLRLQRHAPSVWSVDGTPADCVYFALRQVLPRRPDLLVSGLNPGPNLGQQDVHYSGTVGAAIQAAFLGLPALAASMLPDARGRFHPAFAAEVVRHLAARLLASPLPPGTALNVNIPAPPVRGIKITKLGWKFYDPEIIEKQDPRGNAYFWIGTGQPTHIGDADSDVRAVAAGWISVTPLHTDVTDQALRRSPRLRSLAGPWPAD